MGSTHLSTRSTRYRSGTHSEVGIRRIHRPSPSLQYYFKGYIRLVSVGHFKFLHAQPGTQIGLPLPLVTLRLARKLRRRLPVWGHKSLPQQSLAWRHVLVVRGEGLVAPHTSVTPAFFGGATHFFFTAAFFSVAFRFCGVTFFAVCARRAHPELGSRRQLHRDSA